MTVTATYEASLARVRVAATDAFSASYIKIDRTSDGVRYTTVRGAAALPAAGGVSIDDFEFDPNVVNTYQARSYSAVDALLGTQTQTVTPSIDRAWLKSVRRPFLNTGITVEDYSAIKRSSRAGTFEIPGRSYPVRVGDVASSRSWSYDLLTYSAAEAKSLEFLIASGDEGYLQVPPGFDIPGGYVDLGNMDKSRVSRPLSDARRRFTLQTYNIAAPAPTVVGYAATWAGILADFGSWTAVLAAFATWADVMEYVADPETVIVP